NGTISTSGAVSSFSPFTLATLDMINPLPVEIIEFNAEPKVTSVLVSWVTNSEINNDYFLVERSDDGINFNYITRVEGAGNSTQQIRYEFNDITPLQGTSYYRLKQVDFNVTSNYTNIRKVEFDNKSFVIFPNPATSGQQINIVGDFSTGEN